MPTGYTAAIADDISFNDFVMRCARAMGACVMMREEPHDVLPKEQEPSDYHQRQLKQSKARLEELEAMDVADCREKMLEEYQLETGRYEVSIRKDAELKGKYEVMREKVIEWKPPTEDHKGLKAFMIEQINSSMEHDCGVIQYLTKPEKKDPFEWKGEKIRAAIKDIEYHKKHHGDEISRTNERNKWIRELKQSVQSD